MIVKQRQDADHHITINFVNESHLLLRVKLQLRPTRQGHENHLYIIIIGHTKNYISMCLRFNGKNLHCVKAAGSLS